MARAVCFLSSVATLASAGFGAGRAFAKKRTISLIAGDYLAYVWWPPAASPSARGKPLAVVRPKRKMLDGEKVIPKTTLLLLTVKSSRVGKPSRFASVAVIGDGHTLLSGLIDSHVQISAEGVLTAALALGVTSERAQSGFRPSNLEPARSASFSANSPCVIALKLGTYSVLRITWTPVYFTSPLNRMAILSAAWLRRRVSALTAMNVQPSSR